MMAPPALSKHSFLPLAVLLASSALIFEETLHAPAKKELALLLDIWNASLVLPAKSARWMAQPSRPVLLGSTHLRPNTAALGAALTTTHHSSPPLLVLLVLLEATRTPSATHVVHVLRTRAVSSPTVLSSLLTTLQLQAALRRLVLALLSL